MTVVIRRRAFAACMPKAGAPDRDLEDAFALNHGDRVYAVADGASEASYSGLWARLLVRGFVRCPPASFEGGALARWMEPLRTAWRQRVPWSRLDRFARRNAERGSFSTLAGLRLSLCGLPDAGGEPEGWRWRSVAVGDTCVFQVRDGRIIESFPLREPGEFEGAPYLVGTDATADQDLGEHVHVTEGEALRHDLFALCTDALSRWVLEWPEPAVDLMYALLNCKRHEMGGEFGELVRAQRAAGALRDDDIAIVLVAST